MTKADSGPKQSRWRVSWPVQVLACLFGAALVVYLGGVALVSSTWFQKILLERTRARLAELTGARVEIGQMQIDPWVFQATFRALVLHGTETGGELPLFTAREAIVSLHPYAALRRQVRLRRLDLEGASIHLYTHADGSTNLPGPAATLEASAVLNQILDLRISHLQVGQSVFAWNNRQFAFDLTATNLALLLGLQRGVYSGSFSSSNISLSNPDLRLPSLALSTRIGLARNQLALNSIIWRSPQLSGGGAITVDWRPAATAQFSLRAEGDVGALARIFHRREIRQGRFSADAQGSYGNGVIEARGHLDGRRLSIVLPGVQPLSADFRAEYGLRGNRVDLSHFSASLLGGSIRGKAGFSIDPRRPNASAEIELRSLDLADVLRLVPQASSVLSYFPVSSAVGGTVQIVASGSSAARPHFELAFQAEPSGREPLSGVARGSVDLDRMVSVGLEEVKLDTGHSHLSLHGQLGSASANVNFAVQTTDFEEWRPAAESWVQARLPIKLDAMASFLGTASGTLNNPSIGGHLKIGPFEYQQWKWDGFQADVALNARQINVTSGKLLGANSALTVDLAVGLSEWAFTSTSRLQLSAGADHAPIRGLREVLGVTYPLDGLATGTLHLNRDGGRLTARSSFRVTDGSYAGNKFDSLEGSLSRTADEWKLTGAKLVKGFGQATADAVYNPADRTFSAHARGSGFALADFERVWAPGLAFPRPGSLGRLDGQLSFEGDGSGSVDDPALRGKIDVKELSVGGSALGSLAGTGDWKDRRGEVQAELQGPAGGVKFHTTLSSGGGGSFAATVDYSGLRVDSWLRTLGLGSSGASINATGSANLSGSLQDLPHLEGSTSVQEISFRAAELLWRNEMPFQISLALGRLTVSPFNLLGPSTHFEVQGSADLASRSALNLSAEGELDSAFLHVFSPALVTTGHLDVQAQVRGTLTNPSVYGSLHIHDVSLGYPRLPLHLAGLTGDIDLQGDRVVIRSLRAESGPSSIVVTGGAVLSGTPRYNLRADLTRFRVDYPPQFTSVLNGSLRLSGTPGAGVLSGELTVAQMFVGENFNVLNWASTLENQPSLVPSPSPGLSSNVRLDVHVASAPVVSIESHDLTAVASIDLALRGTVLDPVAFGSVHIQNGQAVLRQTSYKLSRGDIIMANPLRTEAVLDLEARTRIQRYDLILRITGPADHPNISYRSDPPLSTPNILALLAFGYTSQDQLIGQTGRSNLSAQGANAILTQALSTQVSNRITRLFGLSRIGVDPNPSSLGGARVTVEEQLRRDFTITYVNTTGGIQERIIQVEWDVTDNISLLGVRDQNGVYGLELDFRHRFK